MQTRLDRLIKGECEPLIWLLEHEAVYTAGVSAKPNELLRSDVPVYAVNRGGKYTFHGPGQRVVYLVLDLAKIYTLPDPRNYVWRLEEVIIQTLAKFGIKSGRKAGQIGVWVENLGREEKIAAIGVKFKKYACMHGFALNISPDLSYFSGIIPCGISEFGVCSMQSLGVSVNFEEIDKIILENIKKIVFDGLNVDFIDEN
jgi:lipoyl(octanoyl) transferase